MVTRSITLPYLGGSSSIPGTQHGAVRLTNSRMVWVYGQTSPNWIVANIIDVPGGIATSNAPVLTTTQLLTQGTLTTTSAVTMVHRLNDNAFIIMTAVNAKTALTYWTVEIDSSNAMTVTDTNTIALGADFDFTMSQAVGSNSMIFAQMSSDNVIVGNAQLGGYWATVTATYNPAAKKMTWGTAGLLVNGATTGTTLPTASANATSYLIGQTQAWCDWKVSPIPNRPYVMVTRRLGSNFWYNNSGSFSAIYDANGQIYMTPEKLPANSSGIGAYEMTPLEGDRLLVTTNATATVYNVNWATKSYTQLSQGQYSTSTGIDAYGRCIVPLNTDYWLQVSRQQLYTPSATNSRFKVCRRVDSTTIQQSTASLQNGDKGFAISVAPTTSINYYNPYPELLQGKLFWWGFDTLANANVAKFSWTVMGLPAS